MDIRSKQFLEKQDKRQKTIINKLRTLILENFPGIKETGMAEGLWYEGKFYIASFGDHVNLGVGVEGLSENEINNFTGKGRTMRHLKFYSAEEVNKSKLLKLMKLVYKKSNCGCKFNWKD